MDVLEQGSDRPGKRRLVSLGVTALVVIAIGAGGVAYAAGTQTTPTPSTTASPSTAPTPSNTAAPGKSRMRLGHFGFGGALHGQFTVAKEGGGYQTVAVQTGTVERVSDESITVKSEDGYTKSYAVTSSTRVNATRDGIASVKTGHTVHVMATVSGEKMTAVRIADRTLMQENRPSWRPFERMRPGNRGGGTTTPTPTPSTTPS